MKKLLIVLLFLTSANLFAIQEIGRLTWEFRDYDRIWRWEVPVEYQKWTWKESEIHFSSTIPESLFIRKNWVQLYIDSWTGINDKIITRTSNRLVLIGNYAVTEEGRWRSINNYLNIFQNINSSHPKFNHLNIVMVQSIVNEMNRDHPVANFKWRIDYDFDHEEYYFMSLSRRDENNIPHYSFRSVYVIYRD